MQLNCLDVGEQVLKDVCGWGLGPVTIYTEPSSVQIDIVVYVLLQQHNR